MTGTKLLWVSNTESDVFRLGKDGPGVLPGVGPLVLARRTSAGRGRSRRRPAARTSRRSRSSTSDRACSRRCRAPTQAAEAVLLAQIPQTARVDKKQVKAPEVSLSGRAAVPADRADDGGARRQHRQGHHQGRRSLLHVLPGRLVHGPKPERPVGSHRLGAGQIYEIPVSSPSLQRHLRHRRRRQQRRGGVRHGRRLHRDDGRVGLRGVGHRLLLPALRRLRRLLSRLLPVLPDLRLPRARTTRGPAPTAAASSATVRTAAPASARATTRAPAPTRAAPRPTVRTARAASAGAYNPRTGAFGATRQGSNVYGSWGQTGVQRGDQWAATSRVTNNRDRHDHARDAGQRRRRGGHADAARRAAAASRARAAATSTPAATATSTRSRAAAGRSTTTAAGTRPEPTQQQREQAQQRRPTREQAGTRDAADRDGGHSSIAIQRPAPKARSATRDAGSSQRPSGGSRQLPPSGGGGRRSSGGGGRRR